MKRLRQSFLLVALLVSAASCAESKERPPQQRSRRQFEGIGGEWVPLSQPCPTCRPFADPSDTRTKYDDIGLVPPRPPLSPRQVQSTGNFFPQSSQTAGFPQRQRFPDFQSSFNQFSQPSNQFQQQQSFFTQQQQQSFLPQTYLNNPQLLLNENPQLFPLVNNPQLFVPPQKTQLPFQNQPKENQIRFRPEGQKLDLKPPQNIRLEQEKPSPSPAPLTRLELPFNSPPAQFNPGFPTFPQQQPSFPQFTEPQSLLQLSTRDPFLAPPKSNNSDIVIPGLDKEEIQLLYVPVETLRQRGQLQGQTLEEPRPNLFNQPFQQFQQLRNPTGHFITQPPTPSQTLTSSSVTPPPALTQNLPLRQSPQIFSTPTASPSPQPTTEKVVTIQPRPLSTIGTTESRKPTLPFRTTPPQNNFASQTSSPFASFSSAAKEISSNEVTPSFKAERPRFTPRPTFTPFTESPIATTTLQPHQPPLSIYVGLDRNGQTLDILKELKSSENVPVVDSFTSDAPTVFVGPAGLIAPRGYSRYELPYLSNLDPSRIEQRENLPFFVAPLNFNAPLGYMKIPFPPPHVGAVVFLTPNEATHQTTEESVEPESTTTNTPTAPAPTSPSTTRPRGRRPNPYRPGSRRPVSRQRVTERPQEENFTQNLYENEDIQREPQQERKRLPSQRKNRLRTTTEVSSTTESLLPQEIEPQGPPVELESHLMDFDQSPITKPAASVSTDANERPKEPRYPQDDFVPPPPPSVFESARPTLPHVQFQNTPPVFQELPFHQQQSFSPTPGEFEQNPSSAPPQEIQHLTEVSSTPSFVSSTEAPLQESSPSSTGFQEETRNEGQSGADSEVEKEAEQIEIPRKKNRFSYPIGSKSQRSQLRSRPRGTTSTTTVEPVEQEEQEAVQETPETTPTTAKHFSHFNRRKPQRLSTVKSETTTTTQSPSTRSVTIRPLRRSTLRPSTLSKRVRKPTSPAPEEEEIDFESKFVPSAASNEIYDEKPTSTSKPKIRKPFLPRKKIEDDTESTSPSPSTKTYQERNDQIEDEDRPREVNHEESDATELKKTHEDEVKKSHDQETKKGRRRLRVKVQKRPQDNFETAESQNHGSVSNVLIPNEYKPTAPDLYRFNKGEFDFENSGKFITTNQHVRNITADILENTDNFSSPGLDTSVKHVTIVNEHTTVATDSSSTPSESDKKEHVQNVTSTEKYESTISLDTTTAFEQKKDSTEIFSAVDTTEPNIFEATTIEDDETTLFVEATSTAAPTTTTQKPNSHAPVDSRQRKVLRTSTTTQVSHETEICYKGKCIKTSSDNPDEALKRLVEEANQEESAKVKS